MTAQENLAFAAEVRAVVEAIPPGKVLTYGDVAALAGRPDSPRLVGKILGAMGFDSPAPCHRVVNFQGRTAPHWPDQISLLKAEGVAFNRPDIVDLSRYHWLSELKNL